MDSNEKKFVICSSSETLLDILTQMQQISMMTGEYHFLLTSLDLHTINLDTFRFHQARITGVRMVSPDDLLVKGAVDLFKKLYLNEHQPKIQNESLKIERETLIPPGLTDAFLELGAALTYDAVLLLSNIIPQYKAQYGEIQTENVSCEAFSSLFTGGQSIINSLRTIRAFRGLSGNIQFDQNGNRENFELEIIELFEEGISKIGSWNSTTGTHLINKPLTNFKQEIGIRGKNLTVLAALVSSSD